MVHWLLKQLLLTSEDLASPVSRVQRAGHMRPGDLKFHTQGQHRPTNACIRPTAIRALDCEAANAVQDRLRHQTESLCTITHRRRLAKVATELGMGPVSWLSFRSRFLPGKCRATTGGGVSTRLCEAAYAAGARMQAATPNRVIVLHHAQKLRQVSDGGGDGASQLVVVQAQVSAWGNAEQRRGRGSLHDCEAAYAVQEPGRCRLRHQTESACPITNLRFAKFPMVLGMGPVSWLLFRPRNLQGKCRTMLGGGGDPGGTRL